MAINAPEGTRDLLPDEALFWNQFKQTAAEVFGTYGYLPIETPIMEQTELFVRGIGEATDVVSKEMFTAISGENLRRWVEEGKAPKAKSRLSLRPEGTAGVVRAVVQHDLVPQGAAPAKLMYAGPMFRAERPQKGRQRQFNQVGVECLGAEEPTIDAEAIIMLMRFYEKVGIPRDSMRLLLNSMGCEQCRPAYRELVRAYMDEHADELCDTCMTRAEVNPLRAFDCKNPQCAAIMADAPKITDHLCDECREHFETLQTLLTARGIPFKVDTHIVRGLDYYTKTVFEVMVSRGREGLALCGGGRYDGLVEQLGGPATPAAGFGIGTERIIMELENQGVTLPQPPLCDVYIANLGAEAKQPAYLLCQQLRDLGVRAEEDLCGRSLKAQFKYADKIAARYIVIVGGDELARGTVKARTLSTREEQEIPLDGAAEAIRALAQG